MTGVVIRPARGADAGFVAGLAEAFVEFGLPPGCDEREHAAAFAGDLRAALREGAPVFVAEDEHGTPLGFIHLQVVDDLVGRPRAHVSDVAVSPDARGRGVGAALLSFAEAWARERGMESIGLTVFATNERALAVYERLGYRPTLLTLSKAVGGAA